MADGAITDLQTGAVTLPQRTIPLPLNISPQARERLRLPRPPWGVYPALTDADGWKRLAAAYNEMMIAQDAAMADTVQADVTGAELGGVSVQIATPRRAVDDKVVLDIHGGALVLGAGEASVRLVALDIADRTGRLTYAVDYRVPPDHPYPAALDDCVAAYKALLARHPAEKIVVEGLSAGGNLAAALMLRARAAGLPAPAGLILLTPELDLTETGDTFETLMGLDVVLQGRLTTISQLYAGRADMADPYLSPLFGEVGGFPPTMLQSGTRDIFLSNTVLMHRKLRQAGIRAELHVWEGMPHAGFGGAAPEDHELAAEMRAFIGSL